SRRLHCCPGMVSACPCVPPSARSSWPVGWFAAQRVHAAPVHTFPLTAGCFSSTSRRCPEFATSNKAQNTDDFGTPRRGRSRLEPTSCLRRAMSTDRVDALLANLCSDAAAAAGGGVGE